MKTRLKILYMLQQTALAKESEDATTSVYRSRKTAPPGTTIESIMESSGHVLTAINATIACSAILGNGFVIFVMTVRRKQFNSFTNRLIRHQSIIDLIAGIFYLLCKVLQSAPSGTAVGGDTLSGELQCRFIVSDFFIWATNVASSYNLVVISLERFLAACYPVKHRNYCSLVKIRVLMFAVWTIGLVHAIKFPILFHIRQGRCVPTIIPTTTHLFKYFLLDFPFEFFIPASLITFSYARIFVMIRRKLDGSQQSHQRVLSKAKRNVIETMLLAGIMFLMCWSPFQALKVRLVLTHTLSPKLYLFFSGLLACNICVNPVIYCFKYDYFRVQIGQLVRSIFRQNRVQPGEEANGAIR